MNRKIKSILWTLIIIIIIGLIALPKIKDYRAKKNNKTMIGLRQAVAVKTKVINPTLLKEIIKSSGTIIPDEEVDLSFETAGKIAVIYFKEGSYVKKGELLAKLIDDDLQAQLDKLQIQEKLAQEKESRQKILLAKEAVSQESYDQVKTDLQSIESEIKLLRTRIVKTQIHAPFDGKIGLRFVSEGAFVNSNTLIAKLVKNKPLKIDFSIPEKYSGIVQQGTNLQFKIEEVEKWYSAKVYAIEPKIDPKTRTIAVRAIYENANEEIKPGRFVSIELIIREKKDALNIPTEAVIPEMGGERVFIVKNGKAESVSINVGLRTAEEIEVIRGIQPGDSVIISGIMQLRSGMPVVANKE
ncbi:MAG: efflux RND transporter periplasmic adaptor subunit [Bacteroidales bacterium]